MTIFIGRSGYSLLASAGAPKQVTEAIAAATS
jgi:hypothetical protein